MRQVRRWSDFRFGLLVCFGDNDLVVGIVVVADAFDGIAEASHATAEAAAELRLEDDDNALEMRAGDFVNIPAHTRHRVEWTTPDGPTVWLALHHAGEGAER